MDRVHILNLSLFFWHILNLFFSRNLVILLNSYNVIRRTYVFSIVCKHWKSFGIPKTFKV
jgi:hypothetical protein